MEQGRLNETVEGIPLCDIPVLVDCEYAPKSRARALIRDGLLTWDDRRGVYRRTSRGEDLATSIRLRHGLHFVDDAGGGRWHLAGRDEGLHCGEGVEVLLSNGTWLATRFEVTFSDHPNAHNGRVPVLCVGSASGVTLKVEASGQAWDRLVCRWPGD